MECRMDGGLFTVDVEVGTGINQVQNYRSARAKIFREFGVGLEILNAKLVSAR